jgi:hypothetical protein
MGSTSVGSVLDEEQGIIPRAIKHIFEEIKDRKRKSPGSSFKASVSFIEIVSVGFRVQGLGMDHRSRPPCPSSRL